MKRFLSVVLVVFMILSGGVIFATDTSEATQSGTIKVGINAEFPPFEYYEDGVLTGFDIDLMNQIGSLAGYSIEYVDIPFDSLIPAVLSGRIDCAISLISVTEERDKVIDYSKDYLMTNVITYNNGEMSKKRGEYYAIVFRDGLAGSPYEDLENPTDDEKLYIAVNETLTDLSQDKTVRKLMEKYGLDKPIEEADKTIEYQDIRGAGSPAAKTSATSVPPSDWAIESVEKAIKLNIVNAGGNYNYPAAITRKDFCELTYNYLIESGNILSNEEPSVFTFSDTKSISVQNLYNNGIIQGKSETEFVPNDFLTRQEAATILIRLINKFYPDIATTELYYEFSDADDISDWAFGAIQKICNMGIMKGIGDGKFAPKDTYTTEQAVATIIRVFESFEQNAAADANFDKSFTDKLSDAMPNDKNYMFSPFSIKMALMMAANGADGETKTEILKAFGVDDLQSYNESARLMIDKYSESDILKLNISNSIWINSDKTAQRFSKDYKEILSKTFDAEADIVTNKNAANKINGWVNEKTEGKIPTIISENNSDFWAMLINAVYFKARWQTEFNKGATKKDTFISKDGTEKEIDFMNRTGYMKYSNAGGIEAIELPYLTRQDIFDENGRYIETKKLDGIDISMYLLMDNDDFSPEDALKSAEFTTKYVALSVPKFNIEYNTNLNDLLKTLGINKAFSMSAEFEKMFDGGNMWIDSSVHKTYIKVDEEGTEAAAVTGLSLGGSSLPPEPIKVKFDKPFTFVIRDNANGEILFVGEFAFA